MKRFLLLPFILLSIPLYGQTCDPGYELNPMYGIVTGENPWCRPKQVKRITINGPGFWDSWTITEPVLPIEVLPPKPQDAFFLEYMKERARILAKERYLPRLAPAPIYVPIYVPSPSSPPVPLVSAWQDVPRPSLFDPGWAIVESDAQGAPVKRWPMANDDLMYSTDGGKTWKPGLPK